MSSGETSRTKIWADEPFRLLAEIAPGLLWLTDASLSCTYVNQAWAAFTGRSRDALLGNGWREGIHPDDQTQLLDGVQTALEHRKPFALEARLRRHDGEYRWMRADGVPHVTGDGTLIGYIGSCLDIDDVTRTRLALLKKETELAEAQKLAAIGSWQWDQDTGDVTWSDELYRIAGLDRGSPAIGGESHPKLYPPEDWERIARAADEAMRSGTPYELDVEMLTPDGSRKWITARGAVRRNEHGRIVGLHGTVQDITERKQAQQALLESEERLRLAAEAGKMFAFTWDLKTDVISRSGDWSQILGVSAQTPMTGRELLESIHQNDREALRAALSALTPERPQFLVSYRTTRPDDSVIWVERCGRAYFDATNAPEKIIGMASDITERKVAEEELSSLSRRLIDAQEAERARIARDLHDDIGQRLAMLSIELGRLKSLTPDKPTEIQWAVDALLLQTGEIASDLQALSHELHSSKLRLLRLVAAIGGFCSEIASQQKLTIDFTHERVPDDVPPEIALCLFRVLQEALRNAERHSQVRNFSVDLRGTADGIRLVVRDAGCGFDFQSAVRSRGLGLTSMRERLKLVGGDLLIDSQPAKGTTITALIPTPMAQRQSQFAAT